MCTNKFVGPSSARKSLSGLFNKKKKDNYCIHKTYCSYVCPMYQLNHENIEFYDTPREHTYVRQMYYYTDEVLGVILSSETGLWKFEGAVEL
jgi:hypothetical protein